MKLTVNAAGFNNSVQIGTKDGQSARTVKNAVFGGATKLGEDSVAKRREEARKQAWKVVENAWKNDRSVDDTIQSHRDSYAELENRKKGAPVSYTHLRAHETGRNLVCRLLLEKKKITEPTRQADISYAGFCMKKKRKYERKATQTMTTTVQL